MPKSIKPPEITDGFILSEEKTKLFLSFGQRLITFS